MASEDDISWYHGNISREEAEDILFRDGVNENGLFLVRDSSTAAGDYVLSVLQGGEVIHYQIRRHGEDAFYSIEQVIVHGLETLINYYKEESAGLGCSLHGYVKGSPPPPDSRLHGRTNLLHRATREGNLTVVSELLKCGYRSLDAKNQAGETAVHLASKQSDEAILDKLISSGANVNCKDQLGNTPLHYACQNNFLNIVKILIKKGEANLQIRNSTTGWVALHEAASRGHMDIVVTLLEAGAPSRPRTSLGETPDHLARGNGHYQCVEIIKAYVAPISCPPKEEWYHGTLARQEAVKLLEELSFKDGSYLVRFGDKGYALTLAFNNKPFHYQITMQKCYYVIDDGPYLDSLEHLISHYSSMPDGLPTTLQHPVRPQPKPPLPESHPTLTRISRYRSKEQQMTMIPPKSKKLEISLKSETSATLPLPPKPRQPRRSFDSNISLPLDNQGFIPEENLIFKEVLGEGEFGSVYEAIYQNRLGIEVKVAVKTLRKEHMVTNKDEFIREAKLMMSLQHHCIVRLIGLSEGESLLMVQELVPFGSMLSYLHRHPELVNPDYEIFVWASQIALGMEYLEKKKFVHRDLAARNILLASRHQAKISDFGLSRAVNPEEGDYYKATHGGKWPIKWYAPESYNYGNFSSASDVWSFGVTLWEMFSYGQTPYGNLRGAEAIDMVERGERLPRPDSCSPEVYKTMEKCWAYNARDRPSFRQLVTEFRSHTNYENVRQLILETDII